MLSRLIPCVANANYANGSNFTNCLFIEFVELVKFVKFALKKMTRKPLYFLYLLFSFTALSAGGQEAQSVLMLDAGYASVHDSYLTPITYDGVDLALSVEAVRPVRQGQWLWQLNVGANYNFVENPSKNNDLHKLMGDIAFDMQRCWKGVFNPKLNLSAGPMAQLRAGIVYDEVNSNNPVTVRAHANVGATGMAWFNTRLGRKPITLRYQLQLPVAGVFFAPEYDESYYEIYLGNHKNLAHLGWWGNRLDMTNYLGADLKMGKTTLRLGYRNRLEHWTVNHLHVHDVSHSLVLGLSL